MEKMLIPKQVCCVKYFLIICLLSLGSINSYADNDNSYRKEKISLNVVNENLEEVLNRIAELAKVQFFYNHSILHLTKKVTLNLQNRSLEEVLMYLLGDQNVMLEYQLNRVVVIKPRPHFTHNDLVMKISGQVIDAKSKDPLPGASIILKERKGMGVVTDENGRFFIEVPGGITALSISFIGYETETLPIRQDENMTDLVIKLSPQTIEMKGVVVTGMTPRKVEGFTGSYVTVKGEQLKKLSPNNLLKALQIFDPSFRIVENNEMGSDPNTLPEFHLRGDVQIGAITGSGIDMLLGDYSNRPNMPLFILDGFESTLQRIVDLDPERVESVTILKDASATAIYGSRAANGVIVFETKKPLPGALNVSYSMNIGFSVPDLTDYNLMDAGEKLKFEWDAKLFDPTSATQMNYYNAYKAEVLRGVNTYWLSAPLRTAINHRHSFFMEGGDEAIRYNLGLNYGNELGVMKESDRRNMGLNLNLQYRRKKWNVGNQLSLSDTKGNNSPYGSFREYTKLNSYYRQRDENGRYVSVLDRKFVGAGNNAVEPKNPLYNTQFPNKDLSQNFSVTDNFSIECAILENLRVSAQASFSKTIAKSEAFKSKDHTMFSSEMDMTKKGSYSKSVAEGFSWSTNLNVNYNWVLERHALSLNGRWDLSEGKNDGVNLSAKGFPSNNMTDFLFAYEMEDRVSGNESATRSLGVSGGISYMYDFRYAVDFSIRGDLSSQFGADTKMAPFWSVGIRWNMDREKWLENSFVSTLVIRGNYGITGSQNYQPYQAIETYTFDNLLFPYLSSDVLGAELMGFGNPELGWSKTKQRSAIVELGLWQNRINASFNYYNNYTNSLLLDYNISPSTGFSTMTSNIGAIENIGYEAMFSIMPLVDYERQIQWTVSWNGSHNRNRVKKISNMVKKMNEENLNKRGAPEPIYEEGKSTSQLKTVISLGIDPATGKEVFQKKNGEKTFIWDPADKVTVGDTEPKIRGSVSSSLTWKNLSIGLACSYQCGAYRYNQTLVDKIENISIGYNLDRRAAQDRWRKPGDIAKFKDISLLGQDTPNSSRFIEKFNEFKMNSINLGYRLEQKNFKLLEACKIASISLSATVEDIFRCSTVEQERGLDYPFARSFSLSLSVLFN